ncbi:carbamate kinase [endosymbiont 'TC1' of Trimyema compressum]|uniref:carbamate kinase n=1 Tax=endosymbiont 'TC1' of Trimyema compressum TaxID=243899 RepID=UPI0007F0DE6E|nr:carbamate kinase [endosymbiont 'TC1' of Trimyema compressum]AMP20860.1 carbamate kinase [endosymbiont 'TC1' of Trimyema compressum]
MSKTVVVALGGNAILKPKQKGTIEEQMANVLDASRNIVKLVKAGYKVVVAHGNGPQVGNILLQNAAARDQVPAMPLYVCGAESQGQIGFMIQQNIKNELARQGVEKEVATVLTQVIVDKNDPAFKNPTKPVGAFYTEEEAKAGIANGENWVEDSGRGWRKVVASPKPTEVVELDEVKDLIKAGRIVITIGGGGIPVTEDKGILTGVEAVIDKDLASSLLAKELGADYLVIATDVSHVAINFGKPNQENLKTIDMKTAQKYLDEGQFGAGSMGPKVEAIMSFVDHGGEGIITSLDFLTDSVTGDAGTKIVK